MKSLFGKKFVRLVGAMMALTMVSCAPNSSTTNPDDEIVTIDFSDDDYVSHGTIGGFLVDISASSFLSENSSYTCTFNPSTSTDGVIRVVSSREESVSISTIQAGKTEFTVQSHKPGDSIIKIYDSSNVLVYRNIVRVRKAYSETEVISTCYDNDIYRGVKFLGNHRLTFLNKNEVATAQVKGSDDFESNIDISFSCTYSKYIQEIDSYEFTCEVTDNPNNSQTKITVLYISRTGIELKLYYRSGNEDVLFNIFYAGNYAQYYPGILY